MERASTMINKRSLKRLCEMPEMKVPTAYGLAVTATGGHPGADWYAYRDNGAPVLFVAHLDTVAKPSQRTARYADTADGLVIHSRALDDRLGAYIGLEVLPCLGIAVDVLLTVGEEWGQSTASAFDAPKSYDWIVEFDRGVQSDGNIDAVTYQYGDPDWDAAVGEHLTVGDGSYSDICDLEHLGVKAVNWSAGYQPGYHGPRAHAYLADVETSVLAYADFHTANEGNRFSHTARADTWCAGCGTLPSDPWSCPKCDSAYTYADWSNYR